MNTIKSLWLLFAFISTCSADACKKICILDNVNCTTKGGFAVYKNVVNGVEGLIPPLDPLCIDKVDGVLESVKYNLTNITMIGLKNCVVTKLIVNVTDNTYKQYLHCPILISHFYFEADEDSDTPVLCGKGLATITACNYDILNLGKYGVFVNDDHKAHFFIKTHKSRLHLKGKLTFAITKAYIADTSRVNATEQYMNINWRSTEDFLNKPITKQGMKILINGINLFIREFPMGQVLPEDN